MKHFVWILLREDLQNAARWTQLQTVNRANLCFRLDKEMDGQPHQDTVETEPAPRPMHLDFEIRPNKPPTSDTSEQIDAADEGSQQSLAPTTISRYLSTISLACF